jgi:FAD synthetase
MKAIGEATSRFGSHVAIAFNGGKDVTVVMHLLGAYVAMHPMRIQVIYFHNEEKDFEGMKEFVESVCHMYGFSLHVYSADMKAGIEDMCKRHGTKAFFLGTRKTDPRGATQQIFTPSTEGWPDFMLVNPILNWSYTAVWKFLRHYKLRYHPLYSQGYTSLGNRFNTKPNPALRNPDGSYRPAYMLQENELERNGRASAHL